MNACVAAIKKISPFLRATKTLSCAKNRILFLRSVLILISLPGSLKKGGIKENGKYKKPTVLVGSDLVYEREKIFNPSTIS